MAKESYDPYEIDDKFLDDIDKTITQRRFSGVYCPYKNDGKSCAVCSDVRKLWNMHNETKLEKSKYSERAKKFSASASVFMNVVFPESPSEVKILQCGIKMLGMLSNGMRYQEWGPIFHPDKGMTIGVIKSSDSGYNTYTPSPDIKKGVRSLTDKSVLDNLYNLDLIGDLRESVDVFNISSIEKNRRVSFDILPGWNKDEPRKFYKIVYYHYNVGTDDLENGIPDLFGREEEKVSGTVVGEIVNSEPEQVGGTQDDNLSYSLDDVPGCFGKFFSETDDQCLDSSCDKIRDACSEEFKRNQKKAKEQARG